MRDGLSPSEAQGWAVTPGVHPTGAVEASRLLPDRRAGGRDFGDAEKDSGEAWLSPTTVRAHGAALNPPVSRRSLQRAIAGSLVDGPRRKGRGRGIEPIVEYPPATLAQLDNLAAAMRSTHNPVRIRQRLWWGGGPVGAQAGVRSALYMRVREDWENAMMPVRAELARLALIDDDQALGIAACEFEGVLARHRGLRATGLRPPRSAGHSLWAQAFVAAIAGRRDAFVADGARVASGLVATVKPALRVFGAAGGPGLARLLDLLLERPDVVTKVMTEVVGPEFVRWCAAPIGEMPEADAEAARASLRDLQAAASWLTAECDRLATPRLALPDLDRLNVGDDPTLTALMVTAAFGAEWLCRQWAAAPQATTGDH